MSLEYLFDRSNMYIYPWYIADEVVTKDIEVLVGKSVGKVFATLEDEVINIYYEKESTNSIGRKLLTKFKKNKGYIQKVEQSIHELSENLDEFSSDINDVEDFSSKDNKQLIKIYEEYLSKLKRLRVWGWVPVLLDGTFNSHLSDYILEELEDEVDNEKKASSYYSTLSSSEQPSWVQKEELARVNLLLQIRETEDSDKVERLIKKGNAQEIKKEHEEVYQMLEDHLSEYGWLTYEYSGPSMTMHHLLSSLQDNLNEDLKEKQEKLENYSDIIQKQKQELLEELGLSAELEHLLAVSARLMFLKDFRKGAYMRSYVAMDNVLQEISKRLDIKLKQIKHLTFRETKEFLLHDRDYTGVIEERMDGCCYVAENGKVEVRTGSECEDLKNNYVESKKTEVDQKKLEGTTAFSGRVKGTARIVLTVNDIDKVSEGDVLVSSSTNPDLISAMKKASAFVTDTGGVTSHAAIVSREMEKPCVVGTNDATHVIEDGDTIEVDADKGVVKILNDE